MILPHTHAVTLALIVAAMFCWGSWANAYKLGGRWRFEIFYFDFAIGALIAAVLYAFTAGSLGFDGFTFLDDLMHAGKRQWAYAFTGGVVFNLGNMLMTAAIPVAGMAVAFPAGMGLAFVVGAWLNHLIKPGMDSSFLGLSSAFVLAAIAADAVAYKAVARIRHEELAKAGRTGTRRPTAVKGIALALSAGLLMGLCFPLLEKGREGELGLGPYAITAVFAAGLLFSTFIFNLFFMNLPVEGEPVEILEYLTVTLRQHATGIAGGAIWCTGMLASLIATIAETEAPGANATVVRSSIGPTAVYEAVLGAGLIAAVWGIAAWQDFRRADSRVKMLAALMLALFACGLAVVALAPKYAGATMP